MFEENGVTYVFPWLTNGEWQGLCAVRPITGVQARYQKCRKGTTVTSPDRGRLGQRKR